MQITERQHAIILGTMLGDGCLERNGKNIRLRLEHGISQQEYLMWKFTELNTLVTGKPMNVRALHKKSNKFYESLRIYTYSNVALEQYWNMFYPEGKKKVPKEIGCLLTHPLSLALWFMDDGYKRNDCNAFRLSTDGFEESDQRILCDTLSKNFGISSTLHRKGATWNIYIPQKSSRRFVEVIKPFTVPSLRYKITLAP